MFPLGIAGCSQEMNKVALLPIESTIKFVTALDTESIE